MQKRPGNQKKSGRKLLIPILLVLLLLILFFILFYSTSEKASRQQSAKSQTDTIQNKEDTLSKDTTLNSSQPQQKQDSSEALPKKKIIPKQKKDTLQADSLKRDTLKRDTISSDTSAAKQQDTVEAKDTVKLIDPCESDTLQPWVYPDPSGGLHKKELQVYFVANKSVIIEWKFKNETEWKSYSGVPVKITSTETLEYKATDSCGKRLENRAEYYEIERPESVLHCPEGMEYVKVGSNRFCVDRYEWPNKKGSMSTPYISKYGASDSCYSVGKRLCSADEWLLACMGPYSWKYPYGQLYEPNACSTNDTALMISGSKPECRSFFGVFDMSGGLAEWTDTRAVENRQFYYVKGGFWESGQQSSCYEKRYSYYPQNRHNPVGFRCCRDTLTVESTGKGR